MTKPYDRARHTLFLFLCIVGVSLFAYLVASTIRLRYPGIDVDADHYRCIDGHKYIEGRRTGGIAPVFDRVTHLPVACDA